MALLMMTDGQLTSNLACGKPVVSQPLSGHQVPHLSQGREYFTSTRLFWVHSRKSGIENMSLRLRVPWARRSLTVAVPPDSAPGRYLLFRVPEGCPCPISCEMAGSRFDAGNKIHFYNTTLAVKTETKQKGGFFKASFFFFFILLISPNKKINAFIYLIDGFCQRCLLVIA